VRRFADDDLPRPDDPRPRYKTLTLTLPGEETVDARDDAYSLRIRCDHPRTDDGEALGQALLGAAEAQRYDRVLVFADAALREGLERAGLAHEATMPGFYRGESDCVVLGKALSVDRGSLYDPEGVRQVQALIETKRNEAVRTRTLPPTERATVDDAAAIAALVTATFPHYPTPTGVPDYVAQQIGEGVPFRVYREGAEHGQRGAVVACASADLVREAETAELTDCATRPDQRGKGLMQALLSGLIDDLRGLSYPTAFTLARAREPGMNLAFLRLGFAYGGLLKRSCRIGDGMEDMTVWSRRL
jgi:putative beta-lysine N-acetyltransferase